MKFTVMFKTPDVIYRLRDEFEGQEDEETGEYSEEKSAEIDRAIKFVCRYVKYDEVINIEFDTEAETVTVLPVGR